MKKSINYLLEVSYKDVNKIKLLYLLIKEDIWRLILALFFYILKHSPVIILPIILANIINIIVTYSSDSIHKLMINIGIMLIFTVQNIPSHIMYVKLLSISIRNLEFRLREALIRRIQQLSISFHKKYESGRLQSKIIRDVEAVQVLYTQIFEIFFQALINIIFVLIYTYYRKPKMIFFYLITIPMTVLLIRLFRGKIKKRNRAFRTEIELMSSTVTEMINMVQITRAFGTEEKEIHKVKNQLKKIKNKGISLDIINAFFGATTWVVFKLFHLLSITVTAYMAYKKVIPVGDVFMYQGFFTILINSVNMLLNSYSLIAKGFESLSSIGEILECPDIEHNEKKKKVYDVKGNYHFQNVYFKYNKNAKKYALKNLNLKVKSGESIAIVGESGSGKSTFINLILGFYRPTEGKIFLDNINMNLLDLRIYRRFLSVVSQDIILFSGTIRENILYGVEKINEDKLIEAIKLANAYNFIMNLPEGLDTYIGEKGGWLSGGQRQRIAIARAFIRNPKIIIFDEATSSLDSLSEKLITEALKRLAKNRTTFIVSHKLTTIQWVDRIVVLKNGEIIEKGSYKELIKNKGEFYRLKRELR